MKLLSTILLLTCASPALAQTAHHPTAKHRTDAPAKLAATPENPCGPEAQPVVPANLPKVAGCSKTLYALRVIDTTVGTGDLALPLKWYTVNYTGYFSDGKVFDTSIGRGAFSFPAGAGRVIKGWDNGFEGMHIGGKRRIFVPYQLAYGESGHIPIPPRADLIFDVELLSVSDSQPAPPPPSTPPAPAGGGSKPAAPASTERPTTPPADPTKPTAVPPTATQTPKP